VKEETHEKSLKVNNASEVRGLPSSPQDSNPSSSDVRMQSDGTNPTQKREFSAFESNPPEVTSSAEEANSNDSREDRETLSDGMHHNGKNNDRIAATNDVRVSLEQLAKLHPPASVLESKGISRARSMQKPAKHVVAPSASSSKNENSRRHEEGLRWEKELEANLARARTEDDKRRQKQMLIRENNSTPKISRDNFTTESGTKEDGRVRGIAKILLQRIPGRSPKAQTPSRMDDNNGKHVVKIHEPEPSVSKPMKPVSGKASRPRVSTEQEKGIESFELDDLTDESTSPTK
jgi:hypothetical protein